MLSHLFAFLSGAACLYVAIVMVRAVRLRREAVLEDDRPTLPCPWQVHHAEPEPETALDLVDWMHRNAPADGTRFWDPESDPSIEARPVPFIETYATPDAEHVIFEAIQCIWGKSWERAGAA